MIVFEFMSGQTQGEFARTHVGNRQEAG